MSGQWPKIGDTLARLVDERLVDAACAGMAPLFDIDPAPGEDDDATAYRLAAAARVCRGCSVWTACEVAAAEQGRSAVGVWAGRTRGTPGRRGRPNRGAA